MLNHQRVPDEIVLLASSVKSATWQSSEQNSNMSCGILIIVDVSAKSGTPTLDIKMQALDSVSGAWVDIGAVMTQITNTGTYTLMLYPGITVSAAEPNAVNKALPRHWRLFNTIGGTTSFTLSMSGQYLY